MFFEIGIFMAIFAMLPHNVEAQEYIKRVVDEYTDTNIIREYREDTSIVFDFSDEGYPTFMMVSELSTLVSALSIIEQFNIMDFEIWNDTLVFCGKYHHGGETDGLLGFLPLNTFPSSYVRFFNLPEYKSFERLEVFRSCYGGVPHVVMVGNKKSGPYNVIDVIGGLTPIAVFHASSLSQVDCVFDDIAIIDNYVIVASRNTQTDTSFLYWLSHPAPGGHLFYGIVLKAAIGTKVGQKIQLRRMENNDFIVSSINYSMSPARFDVTKMSGFAFSNCIQIPVNTGSGINKHLPVTVEYDKYGGMIDLLTNEKTSSISNSVIYHINSKTWDVNGRRYDLQKINSLDYLTTYPQHMIGSGMGSDNLLWIYMYNPSTRMRCADEESPVWYNVSKTVNLTPLTHTSTRVEKYVSFILQENSTKRYKYKCADDYKEVKTEEDEQ